MKIAVCIPFYKFMEAHAVQSLITMMADIHNHGDVYIPVICHSIFIEKARAVLTETALTKIGDVDYILCIDTDHIYSATALYELIAAMEKEGLGMLSAAYNARNMPKHYAHIQMGKDGKTASKIEVGKAKGVTECYAVGFGFLVFKPDFLRKMWNLHGPNLFVGGVQDGVMYTGDDIRFCELARQAGHNAHFHAGVKVGHISQVVL